MFPAQDPIMSFVTEGRDGKQDLRNDDNTSPSRQKRAWVSPQLVRLDVADTEGAAFTGLDGGVIGASRS